MRHQHGAANRGGYKTIKDNTPLADLPEDGRDCIYVEMTVSLFCIRE